MLIGEFAKKTGISIDTLRYYDKIGLLVPERSKNQREYYQEDIIKIEKIKRLKKMNFSLQEIKYLLQLDEKIDEDLKNGQRNRKKTLELKEMAEEKYCNILEKERDIKIVKQQLVAIIGKADKFLKEG